MCVATSEVLEAKRCTQDERQEVRLPSAPSLLQGTRTVRACVCASEGTDALTQQGV